MNFSLESLKASGLHIKETIASLEARLKQMVPGWH